MTDYEKQSEECYKKFLEVYKGGEGEGWEKIDSGFEGVSHWGKLTSESAIRVLKVKTTNRLNKNIKNFII